MNRGLKLLVQQQRALARLVTGKMSHDLNNIIGAMTGTLSVIERQFADDEKALKRLGLVKKSTEKALEFSDAMSHFCQPEERAVAFIELEELARSFRAQVEEAELGLEIDRFDFARDQQLLIKANQELALGLLFHALSFFHDQVSITFINKAVESATELAGDRRRLAPGNYLEIALCEPVLAAGGEIMNPNSSLLRLPEHLVQVILSINTALIEDITTSEAKTIKLYFHAKNRE